jgi:4-hydroxy-tetrahydrodipicolinate synthase
MFKGSFTAIITPFIDENNLDEKALKKLIKYQLENGTNGLVPCGTTGESPTLSSDEYKKVIEITVSEVNKKIPLLPCTELILRKRL